jgi:hypothetical protein
MITFPTLLPTAEILWKSHSNRGDYLDNMNLRDVSKIASGETYTSNGALCKLWGKSSGLQWKEPYCKIM